MSRAIFPLLLTLASFASCATPDQIAKNRAESGLTDTATVENPWVGIGDGFIVKTKMGACEYVVFDGYHNGGIVHAGDCTNPIHQPDTTSHR